MSTPTRYTITLSDRTVVTYELQRKAVKNINLRIPGDGKLYVSAPPAVPRSRIEDFLHREEAFISRTLATLQKAPVLTLQTGETYYVQGRPYILRVIHGPAEAMWLQGNTLCLEKESDTDWETRRRLYHAFLLQLSQPLLTASLTRCYARVKAYGIPVPRVTIRFMQTRWGSCTPARQTIRLNAYLAIMPDACIDQVVLHELCHFLEANHSARFYAWLSRFMPDWKSQKKALESYRPYCI